MTSGSQTTAVERVRKGTIQEAAASMTYVTTPSAQDDAQLQRDARGGQAESFGVFVARRHAVVLAYLVARASALLAVDDCPPEAA